MSGASIPQPRGTLLVAVAACLLVALVAAAASAGGAPFGATEATRAPAVPRFQHVILVVFENEEVDSILGNSDAPNFNRLAARYATVVNYDAVAHPSLPNYLALISGSTQGIDSDCTDCIVGGTSIADTLAAAKKSWKLYAEGLPSVGFTGASAGRYAKKHNPFVYFRRNLTRSRLQRVVPLTQFASDVARNRLPAFSLIVPDLCHDMHDCSVSTGDTWLGQFVSPLLAGTRLRNSVLFVVFDEGTSDTGGGGRVAALALGPLVRPHSQATRATNHYGLLRTIEQGLRLRLLGRSAHAQSITGIWRSR